jgi:hypothetical protein
MRRLLAAAIVGVLGLVNPMGDAAQTVARVQQPQAQETGEGTFRKQALW